LSWLFEPFPIYTVGFLSFMQSYCNFFWIWDFAFSVYLFFRDTFNYKL